MQGALSYVSGVIHRVKIKHLKPGHTYFYRCGDPDFPGQWSGELNFTMPRATGRNEFPFRLGVIADIGQTYNSSGALLLLVACTTNLASSLTLTLVYSSATHCVAPVSFAALMVLRFVCRKLLRGDACACCCPQ